MATIWPADCPSLLQEEYLSLANVFVETLAPICWSPIWRPSNQSALYFVSRESPWAYDPVAEFEASPLPTWLGPHDP